MASYRDTPPDVKAQEVGNAIHSEHSPADSFAAEKTNGKDLEHSQVEPEHVFHDLTPEEQKRALRKCDYRVIPLLGLLYLVAFIDRSNIGNARIAGMDEDLNLRGMQYNIAVTMYAARFFLGVTEAGFFPASTYLLTLWYKRYEVQGRMAVFYAAASASGAFSGLLAFGIQEMDGIAGLGGWQWIFILEGIVPVLLSFVVWKILPDSPETASFLSDREKAFITSRLSLDSGAGGAKTTNNDKITVQHILSAFKEYKVFFAIPLFWANTIGVYGFTATVPTVINGLGYTAANAQLLTIPIYFFAMFCTIVFAFWSDRVQQRSPFIMVGFSIAAVGFIAELAIPQPRLPGLTYAFLYPIAAGLYCPFIHIVCWTGNNLAPSSKRAIGMALLISVGNMGGIAGSNIFLSRQAPTYPAGFGTGLGIAVIAIGMAYLLRRACHSENEKRRLLIEHEGAAAIKARYTEQELLDLGDKSPFFVYTL